MRNFVVMTKLQNLLSKFLRFLIKLIFLCILLEMSDIVESIYNSDWELFKLLIKTISESNKNYLTKYFIQSIPMILFENCKDLEIIQYVLARDDISTIINHVDNINKMNLLMYSLKYFKSIEIFKFILSKTINIKHEDSIGYTILDYAILSNNEDISNIVMPLFGKDHILPDNILEFIALSNQFNAFNYYITSKKKYYKICKLLTHGYKMNFNSFMRKILLLSPCKTVKNFIQHKYFVIKKDENLNCYKFNNINCINNIMKYYNKPISNYILNKLLGNLLKILIRNQYFSHKYKIMKQKIYLKFIKYLLYQIDSIHISNFKILLDCAKIVYNKISDKLLRKIFKYILYCNIDILDLATIINISDKELTIKIICEYMNGKYLYFDNLKNKKIKKIVKKYYSKELVETSKILMDLDERLSFIKIKKILYYM